MQYIHYHNDFTVPISLVSDSITINPELIGSITFYTRNNGNTYCCCWDCKTLYVDENNVMAVLNGHNLETGVLNYMVEYQIPDDSFPDGYQRICQHYSSDIELTTQNGDITVAEAQIIYGDSIRELLESAGYSYTKKEVDDMIAGLDAQINTYTKPEIDNKLSTKANSADVYTKDEVDGLLENIDVELPDNIVTDANYVHTDNNYTTTEKNKLAGIASGAEVNVQADWNVTDSSSDAFIKNKPSIPSVDSSLTGSTQTNPVQGRAIYTALQGKTDNNWYGDVEEMEADSPDNGTIGFEADSESFYIYDSPNGRWHRIDDGVVDADYVHTDNNYTTTEKNKLAGIASGAEANVQANWNETNASSDAFILNKPTVPTKTSDLTNDSNFIDATDDSNIIRASTIKFFDGIDNYVTMTIDYDEAFGCNTVKFTDLYSGNSSMFQMAPEGYALNIGTRFDSINNAPTAVDGVSTIELSPGYNMIGSRVLRTAVDINFTLSTPLYSDVVTPEYYLYIPATSTLRVTNITFDMSDINVTIKWKDGQAPDILADMSADTSLCYLVIFRLVASKVLLAEAVKYK